MSLPKEQNGIKEDAEISPSLSKIWTGWFNALKYIFLSKIEMPKILKITRPMVQ